MSFKLSHKIYLLIKRVIWIVYGVYAVYWLLSINKLELKISILLCGVLIQLTLMSFLRHWYKFKQPYLLDWFRLATFIAIILDFMTSIKVLDSNSQLLVHNVVNVRTDNALPALLVVLCGLLALKLGETLLLKNYRSNNNIKSNSSIIKTVSFRYKTVFYVFTIVLGVIQLYLLLNGVIGYGVYAEYSTSQYSFLILIVTISGPYVLAIYSIIKYYYKNTDKLFNVFFALYFFLQVIIGFVSGMKEEVISPIIIVLIPYLLGGYKIPRNLIITSFVFVVLLYPINNNYRNNLNANSQINKLESLQLAVGQTLEKGFVENFISGSEDYQGRFSLFPIFMYSIENEEKWVDYKYLDRYIYLPIAWIVPRVIVPNKPVSDIGSKLYEMTAGRNTSSITPSTFGWSYFEGGYILVFISFFIFSVFISFLQKRIKINLLFDLLLFIMILVSLLKVESDIYFKISEILQTILVGYLIYKVFFKIKTKVNVKKGSVSIS